MPSIVLSQQCCEALFYSSEPVMRLDCQILLKSPLLNSLAGSALGGKPRIVLYCVKRNMSESVAVLP